MKTSFHLLKGICVKEKLKIEDEALFAIAKAASGSMRDALSILDQLSSLGEQGVKAFDVYSMLGLVETDLLFDLTNALIDKDCSKALGVFNQLIDNGKEIRQLGRDLTEYYRHLMIAKIGGPNLNDLIDLPKLIKQRLSEQSAKISLSAIIKSIDVLINAQETARVMDNWRMPLEIAFAKLTYTQSAATPVAEAPKQYTPAPSAVPVAPSKVEPQKKTVVNRVAPVEPAKPQSTGPLKVSFVQLLTNWNAFTHNISQRKMSLASYLLEGGLVGLTEGKLTIGFLKGHEFAKEMLESQENRSIIEDVFLNMYGSSIAVEMRIVAELPDKKQEQTVEKALETFGGEVIQEWHND